MQFKFSLNSTEVKDFLLDVSLVDPVFIWGPPGIGKSAVVYEFASELGMDCVSLLGSQLASEDLIGVPKIENDISIFCPPGLIAKKEPYVLFLDELNASSVEVQKAFYSLVHEKRVGSYTMPKGSIVIGAGNRMEDGAIVKPMPTALINRFTHIQMEADASTWLEWARYAQLHPTILAYVEARPDHLTEKPPKEERQFATPRRWEALSKILYSMGENPLEYKLRAAAFGNLSEIIANNFMGFFKIAKDQYKLEKILKGDTHWPAEPRDRDLLYFLAMSLKAKLHKDLPTQKVSLTGDVTAFVHAAKKSLIDLARISEETAAMVIAEDDKGALPSWFLIEITRDLPRLIK